MSGSIARGIPGRHIAIVFSQSDGAVAGVVALRLKSAGRAVTLLPASSLHTVPDFSSADVVLVLLSPDALRSSGLRQVVSLARKAPVRLVWLVAKTLPESQRLPASDVIDASDNLSAALQTLLNILPRSPASIAAHRFSAVLAGVLTFFAILTVIFAPLNRDTVSEVSLLATATVTEIVETDVAIPETVEPVPALEETEVVAEETDPDVSFRRLLTGIRRAETAYEGDTAAGNSPVIFAKFLVSTLGGEAPLMVSFQNLSSGAVTKYAWDFNGDGMTDSTAASPPAYTYTAPGGYQVTLTVTGDEGATARYIEFIEVYAPAAASQTVVAMSAVETGGSSSLLASFVANPVSGPAPLRVGFTNRSRGSIAGYAWDFDGDGVTDSTETQPPAYTYTRPGVYRVTLTAVGTDGAVNTMNGSITVEASAQSGAPVAGFVVSRASGPAPLRVWFTNRSTGAVSAYAWDFNGDGLTDSTDAQPAAFLYAAPGDYRVTLIVTGRAGSHSSSQTIRVAAPLAPKPKASFTAAPLFGSAPLTVTFTGRSTGDITGYAWDFNGDGITDSTAVAPPPYVYTTPGEYRAALIVTGPGGSSDPAVQTISVDAPESGAEPLAIFIATPGFGTAPLTVTFTNRSIGNITGYAWDFNGDGLTDSTAASPPPYTYTRPGEYEVTLVVTGPGGSSEPATDIISVDTPELPSEPVALFIASPLAGTAPHTVTFTNRSTGPITAYAWDFNGDGLTDSTAASPPAYTYTTPGSYQAALTVTGPGGFDGPTITLITVKAPQVAATPEPPPTAAIVARPVTGVAPLTVTFSGQYGGAISSYAWDFNGDGLTDSTAASPPAYTYTTPGSYSVLLTVSGAGGITVAVATITVTAPPVEQTPQPEPMEETPDVEPPEPPDATIFASPLSGTAPLTVTFSGQYGGDILAYAWDFNDDGIVDSTAMQPGPYTYTHPGTYIVSLTVTGPAESLTVIEQIVVEELPPPPVAAFSASPLSGTAPLTVIFVSTSSGAVTGYSWDFNGDGFADSTAAQPAPYTYTTPGIYTATLTVADAHGRISQFSQSITAAVPPPVKTLTPPVETIVPTDVPPETPEASPEAAPEATEPAQVPLPES